ncbi:MAG: ECF transporter S component [Clostridia bacterium]|nr:ECF transporter S component [Clostridia bacterium]
MSNSKTKKQTQNLVLGAIFTALILVLQLMGSFIRFGAFSVNIVLVPIVIGAAMCGVKIGAWLGLVSGIAVLISGDAALFLGFSVAGTIVTVLLKGIACGLAAGLIYKLLNKYNRYIAVFAAAAICPIVNTGVFALGCFVFFFKDIANLAADMGFNNAVSCIFIGFIGVNFLLELAANIILSPVILRVLNFNKK